MDSFKCLIDSNVVIGLEDARPVNALFADFVRSCSAKGIRLFVDEAIYADVARDRDAARRAITESKLAKFEKLREAPRGSDDDLVARYGPIRNDNDRSDVRLLVALDALAIDFLITQDGGLHRRAARAGLSGKVMTVGDAVRWLQQTFDPLQVELPFVTEKLAYEIDRKAPIFESLRADYEGFDQWFDRCAQEHRHCWVLEIGTEVAGLIVRKEETHDQAQTQGRGLKILKLCTFKVRDEFRGEKFGEQLLKQALWFAQKNRFDLVYVTAFEKQEFLIELLGDYGFTFTGKNPRGELVLEKTIQHGDLRACATPLETHRSFYPRFDDGPEVRKFLVPIQPNYHSTLFPEIAYLAALPLLPRVLLVSRTKGWQGSTPGNTIRKVYLCHSKAKQLRPGDILFFYMSKGTEFQFSQSVTSIGVVEKLSTASNYEELSRATAKRSVFSSAELNALVSVGATPVRIIDFLLSAHLDPPIPLPRLLENGVCNGRPPQSIAQLDEDRYRALRRLMDLGFSF